MLKFCSYIHLFSGVCFIRKFVQHIHNYIFNSESLLRSFLNKTNGVCVYILMMELTGKGRT